MCPKIIPAQIKFLELSEIAQNIRNSSKSISAQV